MTTRTPDRPACWTSWSGRQIDDPCDECGHLLIQHVITNEARCVICALLDFQDRLAAFLEVPPTPQPRTLSWRASVHEPITKEDR